MALHPLALLPTELIETLNQIYFLHLLVNDREAVVPPGKSVLSMLLQANLWLPQGDPDAEGGKHTSLLERVQEAAHKAFWREAIEVLSSATPALQIPRLRRLYVDLQEALTPLFPPNHGVLVTLGAPPPPSSSPLLSTVNLFKEVLLRLRERCAPVRDEQIDALLSSLSSPPHFSGPGPLGDSPSKTPDLLISPLAQYVVDQFQAILSLVEDMKSDLHNSVLGSMTEEQIIQVFSAEVKSREREFVVKIWGSDQVDKLWQSWLAQTSQQDVEKMSCSHQWIDRLCKALGADKPVFCVPPDSQSNVSNGSNDLTTNNLPPQLFFLAPTLVYLQNYLQATVITATLRVLARPPPTIPKTVEGNFSDLESEFVQRVWTLLKTEIDADRIVSPSFDDTLTTVPETKLINLADEVVRVRRSCLLVQSLAPDEERRLRDSVERILRTDDPIFLLLKRRLLSALQGKLVTAFGTKVGDKGSSSHIPPSTSAKNKIPARMQTGRDHAALGNGRANVQPKTAPATNIEILGFDHLLGSEVLEAYEKLARCIGWTEGVWGDDLCVITA